MSHTQAKFFEKISPKAAFLPMTKTKKRKIGDIGEEIACKYLRKKDYKILDRNFLKSFGEIDIIAQDGNRLVFIEVKARSTENFGIGRDAIDDEKLRKIKNASIFYIKRNVKYQPLIRYDLIEILGNDVARHLKAIM